jgi:hypothetical protein
MNSSVTQGLARARRAASWSSFTSWLVEREHATVGFSLFRILMAVAMLTVLLPSFADRHYLWGAGSWWVEETASRAGWWEPLRAVFSKTDPLLFDVAFGLLLLLAVLFLVGWKTRWVLPALLLLWVGLSTNNPSLNDGGDALMRIVLFFALFADLGRHLSVDSWLRGRRERAGRPPTRTWVPAWLRAAAHNTALILCCYQMLLIYLTSSVYKLQGEEWLDGTALYYALRLESLQVLPALSEAMWQVTPFVLAATWMTVAVQLLFPVMLLWRPTRYAAVALATLTHLGIAVLLGLWAFSLPMIAIDMLFVRDRSWLKLAAVLNGVSARVRGMLHPALPAADTGEPGPTRIAA